MLYRYRVLGAKIETTIGTAESLAGTEAAFNVFDQIVQNETEMTEQLGQGGFGRKQSIPQGKKGRVIFKCPLGWDGTSTEPGWADTFLPSCGWVKSGQVFTPRTASPGSLVKTLTMAVWNDGKRKLLTGCSGTFKLVCPTGQMAYFEFDYMGVWGGETDTAIVTPTYPTDKALRYATSTSTWNSVAIQSSTLTLDSGNVVVMHEAETDAGYSHAIITDRNSKITADPISKLVATQDRHGLFLDSTEAALTFDIAGPTTSKITIAAPKAQLIKNTEGSRNDITVDQTEWQLNKNASAVDGECSITFIAAS